MSHTRVEPTSEINSKVVEVDVDSMLSKLASLVKIDSNIANIKSKLKCSTLFSMASIIFCNTVKVSPFAYIPLALGCSAYLVYQLHALNENIDEGDKIRNEMIKENSPLLFSVFAPQVIECKASHNRPRTQNITQTSSCGYRPR